MENSENVDILNNKMEYYKINLYNISRLSA